MAASTTHGIDINVAREGVMSYECGVLTPASFGVPGELRRGLLSLYFMKTQGLQCQ